MTSAYQNRIDRLRNEELALGPGTHITEVIYGENCAHQPHAFFTGSLEACRRDATQRIESYFERMDAEDRYNKAVADLERDGRADLGDCVVTVRETTEEERNYGKGEE